MTRFEWPTLLWGERTISVLSDGLQRLDGGAMFGVVPRVLWEKKLPPDERNRIRLGMNCLLVDGPEGRTVVEVGSGGKDDAKFQDIYGLERDGGLPQRLIDRGAPAETVDRVVVYSVQDDFQHPIEPTDGMTFSLYGLTDFQVQGWNGTGWVTLGSVSGNNLVKRTVSFGAYTTDRIRILVTRSKDGGWSRITELEAWTSDATATTPTINYALASQGGAPTSIGRIGPRSRGNVSIPARLVPTGTFRSASPRSGRGSARSSTSS